MNLLKRLKSKDSTGPPEQEGRGRGRRGMGGGGADGASATPKFSDNVLFF